MWNNSSNSSLDRCCCNKTRNTVQTVRIFRQHYLCTPNDWGEFGLEFVATPVLKVDKSAAVTTGSCHNYRCKMFVVRKYINDYCWHAMGRYSCHEYHQYSLQKAVLHTRHNEESVVRKIFTYFIFFYFILKIPKSSTLISLRGVHDDANSIIEQ